MIGQFSVLLRGPVRPNGTEDAGPNAGEEVEDVNTGNSESNSTQWEVGSRTRLMSKNAGQDKNEKWYAFLEDLHNKFSEYAMQKDRQRYNVADLDDWGQPGKQQGISVTHETFEKFITKIGSYNVREYETVKDLNTITGSQIEELNEVLSVTLQHKPTVMCEENHIIAIGSYIVLSELMHDLSSDSDTNNSCNNFEARLAAGKYNLLKVFALNRVFIDADLMFDEKGISVVVIAPDWEVVGSREIRLGGAEGAPPAEPKAKSGAHPGSAGEDGAPGNPGLSGEAFFGIGSNFVNGENLTIVSNGGKGGRGQDGGDGGQGLPGKDAPRPSKNDPPCQWGRFRGEFVCGEIRTYRDDHLFASKIITEYDIYGKSGEAGMKGGDGGKGGNGGYSGNIDIIAMGQPAAIYKRGMYDIPGDDGKGGVGGPGGRPGNHIIGKYSDATSQTSESKYWEDETETREGDRGGIGPVGKNGADGINVKDIKDPLPAKSISKLPYLINEYKLYARELLNNRFQKSALLQFLDLLHSNNDVRKLYDTLALIDEFQGLEEQIPQLGDRIDFSPFYSSLLERISAFATVQKDLQNENKKVLNYIYTATLGRIYNLRKSPDRNLIIDMRAYLNRVEDNIKTLSDLQVINGKVDVINKYKDDYKNGIDAKIKEARSLIDEQISPEIKNTNAKIDEEVNTLIEETIASEKEEEKNLEKEKDRKKKLENAMGLKGLFNCLNIIGGAVSLIGPAGQIAGAVINGASTVGQSLALDDEEKTPNIPEDVSSSLTTLKEKIDASRQQKVDYLNKLVNQVSGVIKKNPEKLGDMTNKTEDIAEKLQKISSKELDFKHVSDLEADLEKAINAKGDDLKKELKKLKDEKTVGALDAIEKIAEIAKFGSLFTKLYDDMKGDKEKIDTVTKSMKEIEDKIGMLKEYERDIYVTTAPMLQQMFDDMKDISAKLGSKSHVSLDVTKWQVQSSLRDMKLKMQKLTQDSGVKEDLTRSIEKLEEVMTTLINVYDRIQSYQDQQNLANYIADISSVAASNINIKDQTLANAVNHLEFAIRANLVIQHYKSAIDALKQWVFPFADHYIDPDMLPRQLELEKNIENLLQTATRQIEAIKEKIRSYDDSIRNGDQYLLCGEFSSRYVSSQPFYVWRNEGNRRPISNLLSGKKVLLKADVEESSPGKDAIKFSEIEFDFKIKNETAQLLLSEILKGFDIYATHLGNSYYRNASEISLISSASVTIVYSYERNDDGMPIRANEVYGRLQSGDLLLSPYTLWEVRMISQTDKYSFQDLEKYKNEINVELSGLGSYVDANMIGFAENNSFAIENNTISPLFGPMSAGLNQCRRSKHRSARSVDGIVVDDDFVTNDASKGKSSPIHFLFNFLKTYIGSNLAMSAHQAFFGEQTSVRNDCSELPGECTEARNVGLTVQSNPTVTDTDATSAENDCIKERIEQKSDITVNVKFNGNNGCLKSFLLSGQEDRDNNHSTQVADLNCSLLLADLVTRTITRNKYKSPIDECLLSPREVMFGRISDGVVRSESEVKQMLQRHLSEKEAKRSSCWFSKLNGYAKSLFQVLGFVGNSDTEEYVQDVRHLFD